MLLLSNPETSWLCYGYWLFGEQICLDQQRAVPICWEQMFVSVAFWKPAFRQKLQNFAYESNTLNTFKTQMFEINGVYFDENLLSLDQMFFAKGLFSIV